MNREKLAKFPTCVSLTFMKSSSPQCGTDADLQLCLERG